MGGDTPCPPVWRDFLKMLLPEQTLIVGYSSLGKAMYDVCLDQVIWWPLVILQPQHCSLLDAIRVFPLVVKT